ncbi:hypothetical protein HDU80_006817 [Chytriomyces hyalinus]|nr:hypothetical protein HDU80_006817 [Chytriomyces hyalinus]
MNAPIHIRIPAPLSRGWVRQIQSLEAQEQQSIHPAVNSKQLFLNILEQDSLPSVKKICDPLLLYMDPPLTLSQSPEPNSGLITIQEFASLNVPSLMSEGFLFIWVEKEFTPFVLKAAISWGFRYIESIAWIKWDKWHRIACEDGTYFKKSKTTCLVFRKSGESMDIRHQRYADCEFDFIKPIRDGLIVQEKPKMIYDLMETMLPSACSSGRMVELFAQQLTQLRSGWTQVINTARTK